MKLLGGKQLAPVEDPVRSKMSMAAPVLKATLFSLARDRIDRLGGLEKITLHDLARECRAGHGDAGICFEYAVHEAIATDSPLVRSLASEILERFCEIRGGAQSILFGPEKEGVIPILESVTNSLTEDSVVYVGNRGRPPKLRRYIPKIISAYRRHEGQNNLPRSIAGLWKADLFLGNQKVDAWVGTTVKINPSALQAARGLRVAIYPKRNRSDTPRLDADLNLVRMPLPYDGEFMEVFYKAFYLVRAFLRADAQVPKPIDLPDAEDRLITEQLQQRRSFPAIGVLEAISRMGQDSLLQASDIEDKTVNATLSESDGLQPTLGLTQEPEVVSVTPIPSES